MKTQFANRCVLCKAPIPIGTDVYYSKDFGAAHWDCYENPKPSPKDLALAQQCGFLPVEIALRANWTEICAPEEQAS